MVARNKTNANKPSGKTEGKTDEKKPRVQREYAPVSLADLKPVKLAAADKVTVIPGRERSDEQKAVDAVVKDLAFEYLAAGSPKQFRDMPVVSYTLPTDQAATVRFMIQKACNLLNCKPKFGRDAWDDGKQVVSFCAIPRDPSQWTDKPVGDQDSPPEGSTSEDAFPVTPAEPFNSESTPTPEETKRTDPNEFAGDDS